MKDTSSLANTLGLAALCILTFPLLKKLYENIWRPKLPPGPPRSFFRDNRPDVPSAYFWKTFRSWSMQYGPVVSFYLGSTPVIVLGTSEAAHDLLEKRGDIYSGRPRIIVGQEIYSGGMRGTGMSYGPRYRRWKSLMQAGLNPTAVVNYRPIQSIESSILLRDILNSNGPLQYKDHIRRFVASIMFCVAYGRRIKALADDLVVRNMKTEELSTLVSRQPFLRSLGFKSSASVPGKFIVDSWPVLLYLPRFLQWFRWEPEKMRQLDAEQYMAAMNDVKRQLADNSAQPSMAAYSLTKLAEFGLSDVEAAYALSSPWSAGVGTTIASIEVFILAMLLFPLVQKKAQEEIDSVVGQSRLPGFQDYGSLPYIQALIKEVTRWRCIAPMGLPHATTADDMHEGMFIPKGSTVYANIYAMTTDPEIFADPDEFRPERFLDTSNPGLINYSIPFGFGRRLCPGKHVAQQTLFITTVRILWAFNIIPSLDEMGNQIIPSAEDFTSGLTTRPTPFPCRFEPRQGSTVEVVHNEAERADAETSAWE
ncbi:cytochrome P450 [Mycena maculata]|uniref:Cytochrome P450 n=1 Tax=Mycena maculata TaxID=230809 RepID=A0AAD7JEA8_9AGAR|nr:cytochrome P450 [Mycena maculata]